MRQPNSKWRRYSYTRFGRFGNESGVYQVHDVETVEGDAGATIYEADSTEDLSNYTVWSEFPTRTGVVSGDKYFKPFKGRDGMFLEWTIDVSAGSYPISFRYAVGTAGYMCELRINGLIVAPNFYFVGTGSFVRWMYRDTVLVGLNEGNNTIKVTSLETGGPNGELLGTGAKR